MRFNIFDEKNVIVIKCHFVADQIANPYTVISYNMIYNRYFPDKNSLDLYIKDDKLKVIGTYELFYYNMLALEADLEGYDLASIGMKHIIELVHKKTGVTVTSNELKSGNRYILSDGTEILYLGHTDKRYHYLLFAEYLKRMEKGKKDFEIDNPARLKSRLTVNYQRMPEVIGDLGPYWNKECFKIKNRKICNIEE